MSTPALHPVLVIYSHGRNPPLQPPPDLKYDLRNIPNPPKAIRTTSDGRSKRLRDHLLAEPKFVQKLDLVAEEIRVAMDEKIASAGLGAQPSQPDSDEGASSEDRDQQAASKEENYENEEASDALADDSLDPNEVVLRVGCNCALGHHRSVAFVEELARRDWPRDWQLQIFHRDLHVKKGGGARAKQKATYRQEKSHTEAMGATPW